jgi:hypothetical protein
MPECIPTILYGVPPSAPEILASQVGSIRQESRKYPSDKFTRLTLAPARTPGVIFIFNARSRAMHHIALSLAVIFLAGFFISAGIAIWTWRHMELTWDPDQNLGTTYYAALFLCAVFAFGALVAGSLTTI